MSRVIHFEIPAQDPEASMSFYTDVFGWSFQRFAGQEYWLATTGEAGQPGINGAVMKRRDPGQPVTNSIGVSDIDAAMRKVESAGGVIVVDKTPIPGVGWFCFFKDPDANILGLMQSDEKAQ